MKRLRFALLVLIVLAAAVVGFGIFAPVDVVAPQLRVQAAAQDVQLSQGSSVVQGTARVGLPFTETDEQRVRWRLAGPSVQPIGVRVDLVATGPIHGQGNLYLSPFPKSATLGNGRFKVAASTLIDAPLLAPEGEFQINVTQGMFLLPGITLTGLEADFTWVDAALQLDEQIVLGTIRGRMTSETDTRLMITISSAGSEIFVAGKMWVDFAEALVELDLFVTLSEEASGSARAVLEGWGQSEEGGYRVKRAFGL